MIPKIIHYCWFGRGEKPELDCRCIESWRNYCPDYEVIEWNETNFDIRSNLFVQQAYEKGKYAFVSDYVRLHALCHYGGIYLDTDVQLIKNLDIFLCNKAFSGFESKTKIQTGVMGSEANFWLFEEFLSRYEGRRFIGMDGEMDLNPNVNILTEILEKYGLEVNNQKQTVRECVLFPQEYFCPKDYVSGEINITPNTYAIHYFNGSWVPEERLKELEEYRRVTAKLGTNMGERYILAKKILKEHGKIALIKRVAHKVCMYFIKPLDKQ